MIKEQLKLIGLNTYEIKAYLTLIYKGKSKASFISQDSGVPNGKIYDVLTSLESKGLAVIIPEEVKRYVATPISKLQELIEEKQKNLKKLSKEIKELENIQQERQEGRIFLVRGKRNFHKITKEIPKCKNYEYTIKWNADVNDLSFMRSTKRSKKKGIDLKTLYDYNTPEENLKIWKKKFPENNYSKKIRANGIAMNINESSVMISDISLNSTILIKSKSFAETMTDLFKNYYDNYKD